jgi:hypothetical protein
MITHQTVGGHSSVGAAGMAKEKRKEDNVHQFAQSNPLFAKVMQYFANRNKNSFQTFIDRLATKTKLPYDDALDVMQRLQQFDVGTLIKDPSTGKQKFVWNFKLISVGRVAIGAQTRFEKMPEAFGDEDEEDQDDVLTRQHRHLEPPAHHFHQQITFTLPDGITRDGARRLLLAMINSL